MKIAHIVNINHTIAPTSSDLKSQLTWFLIEELISQGHQITLFASGDSVTSAQLQAFIPKSIETLKKQSPQIFWDENKINLYHISTAYNCLENIDLVHDHTGTTGALFAHSINKPVVITLYNKLNHKEKEIFHKHGKPYLISTNRTQQKQAPTLNYIGDVQLENVKINIHNIVQDYELIYRETIWHYNWDSKSSIMQDALTTMHTMSQIPTNYIKHL
jgi:hypothetical protein